MPRKQTWKLAKPRRPKGHWENVILPKAADIVRNTPAGIGLRGLFYQLVAAGELYNNANEYTYLSRYVTDARYAGTFPDLIDESREIRQHYGFYSSVEAFKRHLEYVKKSYRREPTEGPALNNYFRGGKRGEGGAAGLLVW